MDDKDLKEALSPAPGAGGTQDIGTEDLARYVDGRMGEEEERALLERLNADRSLQELILSLRESGGSGASEADVPLEWTRRAQALATGLTHGLECPHCHRQISAAHGAVLNRRRWAAYAWLGACALSFAASFCVPRYFVQWTVLAALLGLKWMLDARTVRSQVLIYRALQERSVPAGESKDEFTDPSGRLQKHRAHL